MPIQNGPDPLALDRPDDVRRVREVLDRAGFELGHIRERLAADDMVDLGFGPFDRPRVLRRTRDGDPLATLIRVFLAGVPVPLDDFRRAVEPMDPAAWAELGLVELEGDGARRTVALMPDEGFVIAHDAPLPDGGARRDHVMGVTSSTQTFSRAVIPVPAEWTLDLGTGCGYVALRAAAHSQQRPGHRPEPPRHRHGPFQRDAQPRRQHRRSPRATSSSRPATCGST